MSEERIGKVENYFSKIGVAAIKLEAPLAVGDRIHFKGHTTDFTQEVESMQIEHDAVQEAPAGAEIGIKVSERVRGHDVIFKVTE